MCKYLNVSKRAYYMWDDGKRQAKRDKDNQSLLTKIETVYHESFCSYGSPRIMKELRKQGVLVSRKRVAKLMRQEGIRSVYRLKYVVTTDSKHAYPVAENILNRNFYPEETGKVWVSDITYIRVNQKWTYLTTIIDLADRKVIGWSLSEDMTTKSTVIEAWNKARLHRSIKKGLVFHSDRGVQYASNSFRQIINPNKFITQSMSRKGNCWDNAVAESFFKTLKTEFTKRKRFKNIAELRIGLNWYIDVWYNTKRIHSTLGYLTPLEKEQELNNKNYLKNVA